MSWIEGRPEKEGMYWVHDSVNGVLFAMVVFISDLEDQPESNNKFYYYIMGCDMGFPVEQLTHYILVTPPVKPEGIFTYQEIE